MMSNQNLYQVWLQVIAQLVRWGLICKARIVSWKWYCKVKFMVQTLLFLSWEYFLLPPRLITRVAVYRKESCSSRLATWIKRSPKKLMNWIYLFSWPTVYSYWWCRKFSGFHSVCNFQHGYITLQWVTEAAAAVICLTPEEKTPMAMRYNDGWKMEAIVVLALIASLPP